MNPCKLCEAWAAYHTATARYHAALDTFKAALDTFNAAAEAAGSHTCQKDGA